MLSDKQAERRQRGENFQNELRRSWRRVPNCWQLRITDGKGTGDRPADRLIILSQVNLLCEEKRTDEAVFRLSLLRPNQLQGLLEFEKVTARNFGLVFVSFLNADIDTAYAFRLYDALRYMQRAGRQYITLAELQAQQIKSTALPVITVDGDRGYDVEGVTRCYKLNTATT